MRCVPARGRHAHRGQRHRAASRRAAVRLPGSVRPRVLHDRWREGHGPRRRYRRGRLRDDREALREDGHAGPRAARRRLAELTARLLVEYDGAGFAGWARQPGELRTVQGELETALETLLRRPVALTVAGRTDA